MVSRARELAYLLSEKELRDWETWAKDAIHLKLVRTEADLSNDETTFHPVFTRMCRVDGLDQLFEDEKICGYRGLKIEIFFNCADLYTYFHVSYEQRHETTYDDVIEKISSKMAPGWTKSLSTFTKCEFEPFGNEVSHYDIYSNLFDKSSGESLSYSIFKCNFETPGLRAFHERLQFFLLFYIETSSYIDSNDPIWQLLMVYQKRTVKNGTPSYYIVGYTTLYQFFHYPSSYRLRLSQILILPPYQRSGHGRYLLQQVYQDARINPQYVEINIEDPSPGFQRLRDTMDLQACIENGYFQQSGARRKKMVLEKWDPNNSIVQEIKKKLKLTEKQILRCYEVFKLYNTNMEDEEEYKAYRLEIKARLSHLHREELSVQNYDVNERKRKLHEFYEQRESEYLKLIENLGKDFE